MTEAIDINRATDCLNQGGVLLHLTDSIWGLAAATDSATGIQKLSEIKHRPEGKSYIVLVSDNAMLDSVVAPGYAARVVDESTGQEPVSAVVPAAEAYRFLAAADGTIAVRLVNEIHCRRLIEQFGKPIVSSSANLSNEAVPAHFGEIAEEILDAADYIMRSWRSDETTAKPSRIVRLLPDGGSEVIRD